MGHLTRGPLAVRKKKGKKKKSNKDKQKEQSMLYQRVH